MADQQGRTIRRVTGVDVIRTKQGDGPGSFALDLTLDEVDSYVMVPDPEELGTVLRLFQRSGGVILDQRTDELTFENYGANS